MISSVVEKDKKLLILTNGAYGLRMKQISKSYGIMYSEIEYEWGKPIIINEVENKIKSDSNIKYVAMVHHETTTGILNSIQELSKIGTKYKVTTILDAMSSFAGMPIDLKKTPIDYLVSTSNKCIQGMAGIGFIICKLESLMKIKNNKTISFYLNLYEQYHSLENKGQFRFTPPVQVLYSLNQAIKEYFDEGGYNRYLRYSKSWDTLIMGLNKLGFKYLDFKGHESKILTTVYEPLDDKFNFDEFHDYLYNRGYTIYPGKLKHDNTFRLSNMGDITSNDIDNFITEMKNALNHLGLKVPLS